MVSHPFFIKKGDMKKSNKAKKILFIVLGVICTSLGAVGVVVPVMPTTPFLLLASFFFLKSSKKLHGKLLNTKILGEYIYNYQTYHAIKRKTKIISMVVLWVTLAISAYLVDLVYVRIFLLVVGIAVTVHLALIKTMENIKIDKSGDYYCLNKSHRK